MPDKHEKATLGVATNYKKPKKPKRKTRSTGSAGTGTTRTTTTADDDQGGINWRERLVSATPSAIGVTDWQQKNDQSEAKAKAKAKAKPKTKSKAKSIQSESSTTALSELSSSSGSETNASSSEGSSGENSIESGNRKRKKKRKGLKPESNSWPKKITDFLSFVLFGSRYFYFEDAEEDELRGIFKKLKHKLNKEIVARPPGKKKWMFKKKKSRDLRLMMRMNKSRPTAVVQTVLDLTNPNTGRPDPWMWKKHETHLYNRGESREWTNDTEFLLCALGGVVGLGNLNLTFAILKNGGVTFLLPYWVMCFVIGYPMLMMEMAIGQFTSCGVTMSWEYSKIFQGLSFAIIISVALRAMYYNVIIGWGFYYLYESLKTTMPWTHCQNNWNTYLCIKYKGTTPCDDYKPKLIKEPDGTCIDDKGLVLSFWNKTLAGESDIKTNRQTPAEQFFNYKILGKTQETDITNLGGMEWDNVAFYAVAWICVVLSLRKGISTYAKVPYITVMLPYMCTCVLLIKGLSLDGALTGVNRLFERAVYYDENGDLVEEESLFSLNVWVEAARQIFFSLALGTCTIMNLAKHNRFSADVARDAFIVAFVNCISSQIFAIMLCCYLGFVAETQNREFDELVTKGNDLLFIVMPTAIALQDNSYIWSIMFFTCVVTLGIDSEIMMVKLVVDATFDLFPQFNYLGLLVSSCSIIFLVGSVMCFQGGQYVLNLIAASVGGLFLFSVAFLQIFSVTWIYGVQRFLNDIEYMVGDVVFGVVPWVHVRYAYAFLLRVITPSLCFLLIFMAFSKYVEEKQENPFSENLDQLFVLGFWLAMLFLCIGCGAYFYLKKEGTFLQRVFSLAKATRYWVPLREESLQLYDAQNKYFK